MSDRSGIDKAYFVLPLCAFVCWVLYQIAGDSLVFSLADGPFERILWRFFARPDGYQPNDYVDAANRSLPRILILLLVAGLSLYSIWVNKEMKRKVFLILVTLVSFSYLASTFDLGAVGSLYTVDDYPKFYYITLRNAELLLNYGSYAGYEHGIQGGIPTFFYLRSCFLEFIPFKLIFGDQLGFHLMLYFFILATPICFYYLTLELSKCEETARLCSLVSALQLGLWPAARFGLSPAIVAMPLSFLCMLCFLRYLEGKKYALFWAVFLSWLLVYTHLLLYVTTVAFCAVLCADRLWSREKRTVGFNKLASFGLLNLLVTLPVWVNILAYRQYMTGEYLYFRDVGFSVRATKAIFKLLGSASLAEPLFASIVIILFCFIYSQKPEQKALLRNALIVSVLVFLVPMFRNVGSLDVLAKRVEHYVPFIAVFNLSLFLIFPVTKAIKAVGAILVAIMMVTSYPAPADHRPHVKDPSRIDGELKNYISRDDFVLLENCAHYNAVKKGRNNMGCPTKSGHWVGLLHREYQARMFSQIGEDPHPYNSFRDMYITSGTFRGEKLAPELAPILQEKLRDWGVNKVCVWSRRSQEFFTYADSFESMGQGRIYQCYRANYQPSPAVRLSGGGQGSISDETPFSFGVRLESVGGEETVVINKNYFEYWSARDEEGRPVPLKACDKKICFKASKAGTIHFRYRRNIIWNLISLGTLILLFVYSRRGLGRRFERFKRLFQGDAAGTSKSDDRVSEGPPKKTAVEAPPKQGGPEGAEQQRHKPGDKGGRKRKKKRPR
jgi:hypothetical protein